MLDGLKARLYVLAPLIAQQFRNHGAGRHKPLAASGGVAIGGVVGNRASKDAGVECQKASVDVAQHTAREVDAVH